MIIFFNSQPVTELTKIKKLFNQAQVAYGSDFYDLNSINWLGDRLTVESVFPNWIIKEYTNDPNNVLVVPIIKNYFRWLFSLEYGYGAQLDWENIRSPLTINNIFLEALADFYFPNADFSSTPLNSKLSNIRQFLVRADCNYFNLKGTPTAVKYLISSLLGFNWDDIEVYTADSGCIQINVAAASYDDLMTFKNFLEEHVLPVGIPVIYGIK